MRTYIGKGARMRMDDSADREFAGYFAAAHDRIRRMAYVICGDWHWADDLTQAAFIRLAAGWHRVQDRQALDAFVRTCLIRAYLAETRRVWRRREQSWAEPPETGEGDDTDSVTHRLLFERALRRLPPRQRVTLVCRYYQGLDVAETAVALGCSEGTVKSQTAKGLAALRAVLTSFGISASPLVAGGGEEPPAGPPGVAGTAPPRTGRTGRRRGEPLETRGGVFRWAI